MTLPDLPLAFPALPPQNEHNVPWSPNTETAFGLLRNAYIRAQTVLRQEADAIRLRFHMESLTNDIMPVLEAMENDKDTEGIPSVWLAQAANAIGLMVVHLQAAMHSSDGVEGTRVEHIDPITIVRTGKRGRPRKVINLAYLREAMTPQRNISVSALARQLKIDRHTLSYYLKINNVQRKFSDLSEADLDTLVRTFKTAKPESGLRYLVGFLRRHGARVQRKRVIQSLRRVDGLGRAVRRRTAIQRRKYTSPRPNALWHCDGHHKLIQYGIVIHGFVDGYCRTVTGLRASSNNRADTVLSVFMDAVAAYGIPSRLRGDRGGENVDVSVWMILKRGPNRASFMWGSSTHNTRIERMWVEVGRHFCRSWRAFFSRLERLHRLDRSDPNHLWLLHFLFLDAINDDCSRFQQEWNVHPISGPDTNDRSPADMRFLGQTSEGVYLEDEFEGVHPDVLQQYYGTTRRGVARQPHQTGAGNPPEEEDSDWEDEEGDNLGNRVAVDQEQHIRHEAVPVPDNGSPFDPALLHLFEQLLQQVVQRQVIPAGYGIRPEEWIDGQYPTQELLRTGRRRKEFAIGLPDTIWRTRAELWAQALESMTQLLYRVADQ